MSNHNVCFQGQIRKNIFFVPLLSEAMISWRNTAIQIQGLVKLQSWSTSLVIQSISKAVI